MARLGRPFEKCIVSMEIVAYFILVGTILSQQDEFIIARFEGRISRSGDHKHSNG